MVKSCSSHDIYFESKGGSESVLLKNDKEVHRKTRLQQMDGSTKYQTLTGNFQHTHEKWSWWQPWRLSYHNLYKVIFTHTVIFLFSSYYDWGVGLAEKNSRNPTLICSYQLVNHKLYIGFIVLYFLVSFYFILFCFCL